MLRGFNLPRRSRKLIRAEVVEKKMLFMLLIFVSLVLQHIQHLLFDLL